MNDAVSTPLWQQRFDRWLKAVAAGDQRGLIALTLHTNLGVYLVLAIAAPSPTARITYALACGGLLGLRALNIRAWLGPTALGWLTWAVMHTTITAAIVLHDGIWTVSGLFYLTTPLPILLVFGLRPALAVVAINGLSWLTLTQLELHGLLPVPMRDLSDLYWPLLLYIGLAVSLTTMPLMAYFIQRTLSEQLGERNTLLVNMQANLREQRSQQEQFVASVSHELRTPMNAILGFLQAVDPALVTEKRDQEMLDHMSSSAQQLLRIINDLLDFSQLEAARLRLQPRAFELPSLLRHVLAVYRAELSAKGVGLALDVADDLAWVWGDPERVGQALHKLIQNASKFTLQGTVAVRAWRDPADGLLHIAVRDSGRGIDASEISRVFNRLSRVTSRTRRDMGGTGLGLPIAQSLAQLMGGQIVVDSQIGQGSTFTLQLPLPAAPAPQPSAELTPVSTAKGTLPSGQLLIVDDSPVNRLVAKHLLQSDFPQLAIFEADGAAMALALIAEHAIDLVLMDVIMPEVDGIEATHRILAGGANAATPWVIGLTADTSEDVVQRCLNAGMRSVLAKPFDRQHLVQTVAQSLRQKQSLQV